MKEGKNQRQNAVDIAKNVHLQHRLVYQVCEEEQTIKIVSLWLHYQRERGRAAREHCVRMTVFDTCVCYLLQNTNYI